MTSFEVILCFKGQTTRLLDVTSTTTAEDLHKRVREALQIENNDDVTLKILYKGKVVHPTKEHGRAVFSEPPRKTPKLMVIASSQQLVNTMNEKRSDPTIRGFDNERKAPTASKGAAIWGPEYAAQHKDYKFVRLEACTWQSFGHRAGENTPHAFAAMDLLEKLSTDPGVVAVMMERELVVNTLGEMDPIDDRIMHKKASQGSCLLGYNTNHGLRIDVRLRTDNLQGFLPYAQIVATLLHELSHNWVSEHNYLFWTNYGQMRAEYLHRHATLAARGYVTNGQTTAQVAGVSPLDDQGIASTVLRELGREMAQHGLQPTAIAPAIMERCKDLSAQSQGSQQKLGDGGSSGNKASSTRQGGVQPPSSSAREMALAAAERRAQESKKDEKTGKHKMPE